MHFSIFQFVEIWFRCPVKSKQVGSERIEYKPLSYHKETVLFIPKWLTLCFTWFFHAGRFGFSLIHPNGTGFHNVSSPGWINHPCFSPDSKSLVFTSDQCHISSSHTVTFLSPRLMALDWLNSLIVPTRMGHLGGDTFQQLLLCCQKKGQKAFCDFSDMDFVQRIGAAPQMHGFHWHGFAHLLDSGVALTGAHMHREPACKDLSYETQRYVCVQLASSPSLVQPIFMPATFNIKAMSVFLKTSRLPGSLVWK